MDRAVFNVTICGECLGIDGVHTKTCRWDVPQLPDAGGRASTLADAKREQERQRAIRAVVAAQWRDSFLWLHVIAMCRQTSIERLCEMLAGGLAFDLADAECDLPTPETLVDGAA